MDCIAFGWIIKWMKFVFTKKSNILIILTKMDFEPPGNFPHFKDSFFQSVICVYFFSFAAL